MKLQKYGNIFRIVRIFLKFAVWLEWRILRIAIEFYKYYRIWKKLRARL